MGFRFLQKSLAAGLIGAAFPLTLQASDVVEGKELRKETSWEKEIKSPLPASWQEMDLFLWKALLSSDKQAWESSPQLWGSPPQPLLPQKKNQEKNSLQAVLEQIQRSKNDVNLKTNKREKASPYTSFKKPESLHSKGRDPYQIKTWSSTSKETAKPDLLSPALTTLLHPDGTYLPLKKEPISQAPSSWNPLHNKTEALGSFPSQDLQKLGQRPGISWQKKPSPSQTLSTPAFEHLHQQKETLVKSPYPTDALEKPSQPSPHSLSSRNNRVWAHKVWEKTSLPSSPSEALLPQELETRKASSQLSSSYKPTFLPASSRYASPSQVHQVRQTWIKDPFDSLSPRMRHRLER